jgi:zinc transport system substrate-binding protein
MRKFPIRRGALGALLVVGLVAVGASSCSSGGKSTTNEGAAGAPKVVVSTTWVGAIAKLAGATDITVIAPTNVQHPPDYDPKASDLASLSSADYVLLAGFEGFAARMKEAAGSSAKVLTVMPDYDPKIVATEVAKLATEWNSTKTADANVAAYTADYNKVSAKLKETTSKTAQKVVAQKFVAGWADFAGYQVTGTFGPEPITAAQVAELSALKPTLVFENSHMPSGSEVASASGAKMVSLVNFPGKDLELSPVLDTNAATITKAVGG